MPFTNTAVRLRRRRRALLTRPARTRTQLNRHRGASFRTDTIL